MIDWICSMNEVMVIEFLKIQVEAGHLQQYIEAEQRIWSTYLSGCKGFVNKEVWLDPEDESITYIRILWSSYEQWKAISPEHMKNLDATLTERIGQVWQIVESKEYIPVSCVLGSED